MNINDTEYNETATLLLGLKGLGVAATEDQAEAGVVVHAVTADEAARACPECGVFSTTRKERVLTCPRHLPCGGRRVAIRWHKTRWRCRETRCRRATFTEQVEDVSARARLSTPLRRAAGAAVADGGGTVAQAGRDLGLSWPVAMGALTRYAAQVPPAEPAATAAVGIDETRRGRPVWRPDPDTGKWELVADAFHIGFVDAVGGGGLFGQVEGRTSAAVSAWIHAQPAHWRQQVGYVAIDLCPAFRAAVRRALPQARIVADAFHVVQLAQRHLAQVRRRLTWKQHGRRARAGDAVFTVRGLLRRNAEDLRADQRARLETELKQMGTYGRQIFQAWQAKELLRDLLRLGAKHTGHAPARSAISTARYRFLAFCADRPHLGELITLARTTDAWWDEIEAYLHTGITNAASEGNNRLIKLEARNAFGFRNRANQRLRSHCATTRRARREGLPA